MSPRRLSRRLKENNVTFQFLVNEVKSQRATNYLQKTKLPIEEVATLMGFNDCSNFRRAFSCWTRMVPSRFRKEKAIEIMVK
jgi:AraC-like DNA-binding protein